MNLGEAKKRALKHLGEYSSDGVINSSAKTADYQMTMNSSADTAQTELAHISKIEASQEIYQEAPTTDDEYSKYDLPEDIMDLREIRLNGVYFRDYRAEGTRTLVIPTQYIGKFEVFYYRYPTVINDSTSDSYEFEIATDAQQSIPFLLAANAIMPENDQLGTMFLNRYEDSKSFIRRTKIRNPRQIIDVRAWY